MTESNGVGSNDNESIDAGRREALWTLARAAWAAPVVASFALGGLSVSSNWAQAAYGPTSS